MKRVKSTPGTVVFKSKNHHVSFAFGIGKRSGVIFGEGYDRDEMYFEMYD